MASKSLKTQWRFGGSLNKIYLYGAQEWNVNWINKYVESLKRGVMVFDNTCIFRVGYQLSFVSNILLIGVMYNTDFLWV